MTARRQAPPSPPSPAGRLVASLLYGVKATDPGAMTIAAAILFSIAPIASLLPAWRAAQADPVEALRSE